MLERIKSHSMYNSNWYILKSKFKWCMFAYWESDDDRTTIYTLHTNIKDNNPIWYYCEDVEDEIQLDECSVEQFNSLIFEDEHKWY